MIQDNNSTNDKTLLRSYNFKKRKILFFYLFLCSVFCPQAYTAQCHSSTLPPGVSVSASCRFRLKDSCSMTCKINGATKWKMRARCLKSGKWSPLPACKNKSQKLTDCDKRPGCKKKVSKCRTMIFSSTSMYLGKCGSQSVGGSCYLTCKGGGKFVDGKSYITCSKNGKWTRPRKCYCPDIDPPNGYMLKENCAEKLPGETCRVACINTRQEDYVKCGNSASWGSFPPCKLEFCPPPLLEKKLKSLESCDQKKNGETCKLFCENGGVLRGREEIYCNVELSWSPVPKCVCPKPILPPTTESRGSCEEKAPGEKCYISCRAEIPNKDFIVCLMRPHMMWSVLPNCSSLLKCSYPTHLNPYVKLRKDCEDLVNFPVGKTCNVYCENRGKIIRGTKITCISRNKWSSSPICTCVTPPRDPSLNLNDCSATLPGTRCKVSCKEGVAEKEDLLCDNFYNWDKLPACKKPCRDVYSDRDLTFHKCKNLMSGERCEVECKNSARVIGANSLVCVEHSRYMWMGVKPKCVCMPPLLTHRHILKENCSSKKRGERCLIGCKTKIVDDAYSTCIMEKNRMWTPLPDC